MVICDEEWRSKGRVQVATMSKVSERLNVLNMSKEMRDAYFNYTKEIATFKEALETAEEKGIKKGKEEGIKEGIEKGKEEEKLETAKTC